MGRPLIATDTELFVGKAEPDEKDKETGALVRKGAIAPFPICGMIGGTKQNPIPIPGIKAPGFLMQEDGVTLEFNIPPCHNASEFIDAVSYAMKHLGALCKARGLSILKHPAALKYPSLLEEGASSKWPTAFEIGCSPDFSAYADNPSVARDRPEIGQFGQERFAGMHFHVSFENPHSIPDWVVVRFIDLYVYLPMMMLDKQEGRLGWYGRPGLFRPTKYPDGSTGIEYRTPSNFFAFNSSYMSYMASGILNTINSLISNPEESSKLFSQIDWDGVSDAILDRDVKTARELYDFCSQNSGWRKQQVPWLNGHSGPESEYDLDAILRAAKAPLLRGRRG